MEEKAKGKTEMVASQENKTQMVASKVKIKALRPLLLADGSHVSPGSIIEVSESEAKSIVDRRAKGPYAFSGERTGQTDADRHDIRRAVRV